MNYQQADITLEIAESALSCCDASDRDEWVKMGMCLKSEFGHDAFEVFDRWSQNYDSYKPSVVSDVWKSFNKSGLKIGTLIDAALKNGFRFEVKEISTEERKELEKVRAKKQKERKIEEDAANKKIDDYRSDLREKLTNAVNNSNAFSFEGKSEYLEKKGVQAFGVMFPYEPIVFINDKDKSLAGVISGHSDFSAFLKQNKDSKPVNRVVKKGAIMIPLYDSHFNIWNFQVIYNTGRKRFLSGRKQGLFFIIGQIPETGRFNLAFAEGYATGASIYQSLDYKTPVVVTFDAGNMLPVTKNIDDLYGDRVNQYLFCADNDTHLKDKNGKVINKGFKKATEAAAHVDGLVIIPKIDAVVKKDDDVDRLYVEAVNFVVSSKKAGISNLQKHLSIGYNRAAHLLDSMQNNKVVSMKDEKGRRVVLVESTFEIEGA